MAYITNDEGTRWVDDSSAPAPSPASDTPVKTNRQAHEEAAGMGLCDEFFTFNGIDPNAPYETASEQDEMERARSFRRKWSKIGDVEADAEMLDAFATQKVAAERKRVLDEAERICNRFIQSGRQSGTSTGILELARNEIIRKLESRNG